MGSVVESTSAGGPVTKRIADGLGGKAEMDYSTELEGLHQEAEALGSRDGVGGGHPA